MSPEKPDKEGNTQSEPSCAQELDLSAVYGKQVAAQLPIIESVLRRAAAAKKVSLTEADLDAFCRERQAKLNLHSQQDADDDFERVRLLNMLYEGCLNFLKEAAAAAERSEHEIVTSKSQRVEKIIRYLAETTDCEKGGEIAAELIRLYDFSICHLSEACAENSTAKILAVHSIIEKIYSGYLEVEIEQDANQMFEAKRLRDCESDTHAGDREVLGN